MYATNRYDKKGYENKDTVRLGDSEHVGRIPHPRKMQLKNLLQLGVSGDAQGKGLKIEGHFYLYLSKLGNSVPIQALICPESPRLTRYS